MRKQQRKEKRKEGNKEKLENRKERRKFYEFVPNPIELDFLRSLKEGKIFGLACMICTKIFVPAFPACIFCGSKNLKKVDIDLEGEVIAQTTIHIKNPLSPFDPPYSILGIKLKKVNSFFYVLTKDTSIYVGDEIKISLSPEDEIHPLLKIKVEKKKKPVEEEEEKTFEFI